MAPPIGLEWQLRSDFPVECVHRDAADRAVDRPPRRRRDLGHEAVAPHLRIEVLGPEEGGRPRWQSLVEVPLAADRAHALPREVGLGRELREEQPTALAQYAGRLHHGALPLRPTFRAVEDTERDDEVEGAVVVFREIVHPPQPNPLCGLFRAQDRRHAPPRLRDHRTGRVDGVDVEPALRKEDGVPAASATDVEDLDRARLGVVFDQPDEAVIRRTGGEALDHLRSLPEIPLIAHGTAPMVGTVGEHFMATHLTGIYSERGIMANRPEAWLRGPIPGVSPWLMPAAHALVQAGEDAERAARGLSTDELWQRPGGAAAAGFHLRHIPGVLDRLLTYARGEMLSDEQLAALRFEGEPGEPPEDVDSLLDKLHAAIENALEVLRTTPDSVLLEPREVGRARLPSTVLGLLSHAAEHAQRHTGQLITTVKVVRGATGSTR